MREAELGKGDREGPILLAHFFKVPLGVLSPRDLASVELLARARIHGHMNPGGSTEQASIFPSQELCSDRTAGKWTSLSRCPWEVW